MRELPRARSAPDLTTTDNGVTLMIVCAGGPMTKTLARLQFELDTGRRVTVVATPQAGEWLDHYEASSVIEDMTGWPVRSTLPPPTVPTFDPPASSVLVSPCTLNTLTKWADAHSDNLAVSLLCEAAGRRVPTRAEVSLSSAYVVLPAVDRALHTLTELGVDLYQAAGSAPHALLRPLPSEVARVVAAASDD